MNVLVTGASGLLGHALALRLTQDGDNVRVLLRDPEKQLPLFGDTAVEWVKGSLQDKERLFDAVKGVDEVYHCAATSTDWAPWKQFVAGNVDGVRNLLEVVKEHCNLRRFLHVSSTDVYGYPKSPCSEDVAMKDAGLPYNMTKIAGEKLVRAAGVEGLPITIVRPATIYGPRDHDFVTEVFQQLKQNNMPLIGGGRSSPGLLFINNAVDGLIAAARSPNTIGKVYNLRDESAETWEEYLHEFADQAELPRTKLRLPLWFAWSMACSLEVVHKLLGWKARPLLTRHTVYLMTRDAAFPIDRARKDFGFRSKVSFQEAVARSVDWVRSQQLDERGPAILGR